MKHSSDSIDNLFLLNSPGHVEDFDKSSLIKISEETYSRITPPKFLVTSTIDPIFFLFTFIPVDPAHLSV